MASKKKRAQQAQAAKPSYWKDPKTWIALLALLGVPTIVGTYVLQRPRLAIVSITADGPIRGDGKWPTVYVVTKNVGQDTSSDVSAQAVMVVLKDLPDGDLPQDLTVESLIGPAPGQGVSRIVSTGHVEPTAFSTLVIRPPEELMLGTSDRTFYAIGRIRYHGPWRQRFTEFCVKNSPALSSTLVNCPKWHDAN